MQRHSRTLHSSGIYNLCCHRDLPYSFSFFVQFFNQVLILGKEDKQLFIATKVYDLIYELYHVCSRVLLSVLPQLEFKLKSPDEQERMGCVSLLARMFSEKDSQLATQHRQLWRAFLGRYIVFYLSFFFFLSLVLEYQHNPLIILVDSMTLA